MKKPFQDPPIESFEAMIISSLSLTTMRLTSKQEVTLADVAELELPFGNLIEHEKSKYNLEEKIPNSEYSYDELFWLMKISKQILFYHLRLLFVDKTDIIDNIILVRYLCMYLAICSGNIERAGQVPDVPLMVEYHKLSVPDGNMDAFKQVYNMICNELSDQDFIDQVSHISIVKKSCVDGLVGFIMAIDANPSEILNKIHEMN